MNVLDYAIKMENEGERLFERLGHETDNGELKEIFAILASGEREHIMKLETLKETISPADAQSVMVERAAHLQGSFGRLLDAPELFHELKHDSDRFVHIVKAEEENIHILEGMAAAEPNKKASILLLAIAEEEKEHLTTMEYIYDYMEAPRTYLEWGEFGNLHPL
jgi:rubrerythrin